eukprot:6538720-Alexandrium_andersonii.AAC.1
MNVHLNICAQIAPRFTVSCHHVRCPLPCRHVCHASAASISSCVMLRKKGWVSLRSSREGARSRAHR